MSLVAAALLALEGFVLVADTQGVRVWRRGAGHEIELAAEGDLPAPPEQVLRVLADYAHHPRWVHQLAESRLLSRTERGLDVYQRLHLPVVEDRDFTLHVAWGVDGQTRWLRFATANDRGPPPVARVVRLAVHEGSWTLAPTGVGHTHATYHVRIDLSGSLPAWLVRGRMAHDVPGLFRAIGKELASYR
jgi:hypothetical protein